MAEPQNPPRKTVERSFHRYSTSFPGGLQRPIDHVELGPDLPTNLDRRLLGDLSGKRVLELGAGMAHGSVAMAKQGAKVIAVDPDIGQLDHARELCDAEEVVVELKHSDLADLAFLRENSFDAVVSVFAMAAAPDLDRVFRQVHRILRPEGPFVFSLPHPAATLVDALAENPNEIVQSYFDTEPLGSGPTLTYPHPITDVFTGLIRANFRVDTLLEPTPSTDGVNVPQTLVVRGKKVGS
ncbi:MAG: class I SAM-dependent methyltransferase [Acidimicrobiales bacterium]|nr:class I SAM-dependent methyltransferase [Acidimicrobiales bacterium]